MTFYYPGFTTSSVDNIDHNTSSTCAEGSFHGMGISLFQQPEDKNVGREQTHTCTPFDNPSRNISRWICIGTSFGDYKKPTPSRNSWTDKMKLLKKWCEYVHVKLLPPNQMRRYPVVNNYMYMYYGQHIMQVDRWT